MTGQMKTEVRAAQNHRLLETPLTDVAFSSHCVREYHVANFRVEPKLVRPVRNFRHDKETIEDIDKALAHRLHGPPVAFGLA